MAVEAVPDRIQASRPAARAALDLGDLGRVGHGAGPRELRKNLARARVEVLLGPNSANESTYLGERPNHVQLGPYPVKDPTIILAKDPTVILLKTQPLSWRKTQQLSWRRRRRRRRRS